MTNEKLSDIFYQPENLWTGRKAIKLLKQESKESIKAVKSWLAMQTLWQIHLPRPKKINIYRMIKSIKIRINTL